MKKLLSTIVILFLALVSLAPFSVQAQSGVKPKTPLCFFTGGTPYVQWSTRDADGVPQCPNSNFDQIPHNNIADADLVGVCWNNTSNGKYVVGVANTVNTNGSFTCTVNPPDGSQWQHFIPRSSFRGSTAQPPTNTDNKGNKNVPPANNGGTTDQDPQIADCSESGFHAVGPLCVPNSPFANSNGIAGTGNVTDLAVKIIRILLFFAGIVAVIMIIIGGYLYMTARGNDTQATNGRKTLVNALIGLAIIILSYIIVQAVYSFLIK